MSSTDKNSEVAVEVAAEEKAETKEIKATKRPAEAMANMNVFNNLPLSAGLPPTTAFNSESPVALRNVIPSDKSPETKKQKKEENGAAEEEEVDEEGEELEDEEYDLPYGEEDIDAEDEEEVEGEDEVDDEEDDA